MERIYKISKGGFATMNYKKIIDLYNVTIEDCIHLYENEKLCTLIKDDHVVNFFIENEERKRKE